MEQIADEHATKETGTLVVKVQDSAVGMAGIIGLGFVQSQRNPSWMKEDLGDRMERGGQQRAKVDLLDAV